jgi:Holliday junction resolvasome RuvABC ATP-dependent DNA helicase subunit
MDEREVQAEVDRILGYEKPWMRTINESINASPLSVGLEFYGQGGAKKQIEPFLRRTESFPNTLILGQPGVGKTRMAKWIADQRAESFDELLCPVNPDDVPRWGIVLLDEVHRQRHPEWLFPVMEDKNVTVLGATTKPEALDSAFKSRFMLTLHLKRYENKAMIQMAKSIVALTDEDAALYASASAGNPRQLEMILTVAKELGVKNVEDVLAACQITIDGLTGYHLDVLRGLQRVARPIGLSSLASLLFSDEQSVKEAEQLLFELGLVELKPNGRLISKLGKTYIRSLEQTPK